MTRAFAISHHKWYVSSIADAQKRSVPASIVKRRHADTHEAGDQAPSLALARLSGGDVVRLA